MLVGLKLKKVWLRCNFELKANSRFNKNQISKYDFSNVYLL